MPTSAGCCRSPDQVTVMRHTLVRGAMLALAARALLPSSGRALVANTLYYWSPCVSPTDVYGPAIRYGLGIPWLYVPPEPMAECGPPLWLSKMSRPYCGGKR